MQLWCINVSKVRHLATCKTTSFPGFFLTRSLSRSVGRVGENPGNEVACQINFQLELLSMIDRLDIFVTLVWKYGITTAAVSEPEASERGNSLIGKKLHYRGIQSLFLTKRKELWLCATQRFRMRNGLARNCGYQVLVEDLGCAVDSQGIVAMLEWEI